MPLSFTEKKRIRYSFRKIGKTIEVPNLVDIQKISYDKFLQLGKAVENRSNTGLQEVFNSVFPIKDYAGKSELHYIDYYLDNFASEDKAGSYAIQDWIGIFKVRKMQGCFFNVVGMPASKLCDKLNLFL